MSLLPAEFEPVTTAADLPDYAPQIAAFHRAFAPELRAVVASLPLNPQMRVLDVGCGDGFYTGLLADRLQPQGTAIGLDVNESFLDVARRRPALVQARCQVQLLAGDISALPEEARGCDFVWCAQSLYSLPEPVSAVRQMSAALKPGGLLAVLENDTLHQLLLPWPSDLEMTLRAAELRAFADESSRPGKFYVGRRLPAVLAEAGLEPLSFRTQCIDRQAPLSDDLEAFLHSYLERLNERVQHYLDEAMAARFAELIDSSNPQYLLRQPWFTMSWLNVLAWGRLPLQITPTGK